MRAVITGGTGYIGGRLLRIAVQRGWDVCALVAPGDETPLPAGVERVTDPGTSSALAARLVKFAPDAVWHLAACQDLSGSSEAADALVATNLGFGARVLEAAHVAGAHAFVSAGSFAVHALGESAYAPQNLYAATKQAFTDLAAHYSASTPMKTVVLELSDTYGPDDPRPKFLSLLDRAARTGKVLQATAGEQRMRPLHVDDIAEAFLHATEALLAGQALSQTHSVAGPDEVTLRELADVFARATGLTPPVEWGARPYRTGEIMRPYTGDPLPGWSPRIHLAQGLESVWGRAGS